MSIIYALKSEKKYIGVLYNTFPELKIEVTPTNEPICSVSEEDFKLWFGVADVTSIGMLRDANEYLTASSYETGKKIISVKIDKSVKPGTLLISSHYKTFFNALTFKCVPVSSPLETHHSLNFYLNTSEIQKIKKNNVIDALQLLFVNTVFTKHHNNITYNILVDGVVINAKVYNIYKSATMSEHTRLFFETATNVQFLHSWDPNKQTKITLPTLDTLDVPIQKLKFKEIPIEPQHLQLSVDFSSLKIGGLRDQLINIANVIRPRGVEKKHLDKIGMTEFEKGIILYGLPGTGKTLIARELSNILGVKNFVVINGPEMLTKYVGESEANIRNILRNYTNDLKIVFFDEFDSLAKERTNEGGTGATVANNIVNQILSIMDGVEQSNNLLIIAATNRIDVIDPALLRPGRFGLCLHIGLPNKQEREEIFQIHLTQNIENKSLDSNVALSWLADCAQNYTGAEIKGVCKKARELALGEAAPDLCRLDKVDTTLLDLKKRHFEQAFQLVKCGFAGNFCKIDDLLPKGDGCQKAILDCIAFCNKHAADSRINTYLLSGTARSYKSATCRVVCEKMKSQYDTIVIINDNFVREIGKIDTMIGKNILIILDSLENLCGILNINAYNQRCVESLNKFVNKVVHGKVMLIATMRTAARGVFDIINPAFEWDCCLEI